MQRDELAGAIIVGVLGAGLGTYALLQTVQGKEAVTPAGRQAFHDAIEAWPGTLINGAITNAPIFLGLIAAALALNVKAKRRKAAGGKFP